jgi:hypothetical protein
VFFENKGSEIMTRFFLTQDINDSICLRGRITSSVSGFNYTSFTQNGSSRKPKATINACIPRNFTGYIVDTETGQDAVDLTVAYRDGQHWASEAALGGEVRTVRGGRMDLGEGGS